MTTDGSAVGRLSTVLARLEKHLGRTSEPAMTGLTAFVVPESLCSSNYRKELLSTRTDVISGANQLVNTDSASRSLPNRPTETSVQLLRARVRATISWHASSSVG